MPLARQQSFIPAAATSSPTETVKKIRQLSIAVRAAQLKSRPPIIASITGLPLAKVRAIFKEVTGCDPVKGQLPSDTSFYINDVDCHFESIWLIQIYRLLSHSEDSHSEQYEYMFMTYELYLTKFARPVITFDRFFILLRHTFFGNEIALRTCRDCGSANITVKRWDPTKEVRCPICYLTAQAARHQDSSW